jgi:hypothetical protein
MLEAGIRPTPVSVDEPAARRKNVEVWNTMIPGYVDNGQFSQAKDPFPDTTFVYRIPVDVS